MNLNNLSKNDGLEKISKLICQLTLRRADLEKLARKCRNQEEFGKMVEGCFVRIRIDGHNLISQIHSVIAPVKIQMLNFGMRLYLPFLGFFGINQILADFPKFDDAHFLSSIGDYIREYSFSMCEEKIGDKIKNIEKLLGENWQKMDGKNEEMERKLDEIGGTDVNGPGELFRILVYPEELVKLLGLGTEEFERAAVGLFVQIQVEKIPLPPAFEGSGRFVAQIAAVNWPKNGDHQIALKDMELEFEKIGAFPVQFIAEKVTPSFARECLRKTMEMGIPLPSKEFILEKQKQFRISFEKLAMHANRPSSAYSQIWQPILVSMPISSTNSLQSAHSPNRRQFSLQNDQIQMNGEMGNGKSAEIAGGKIMEENEEERRMKEAFFELHQSFLPSSTKILFDFPFMQKIKQNCEEWREKNKNSLNGFENSAKRSQIGEGRKMISYEGEFGVGEEKTQNGNGANEELGQNWTSKRRKVTFNENELDAQKGQKNEPILRQQRASIFERIRMDPDGQEKLADGILKSRQMRKRVNFAGQMPFPDAPIQPPNQFSAFDDPSIFNSANLAIVHCPACKIALRAQFEEMPPDDGGTMFLCRNCNHRFQINRPLF